VREREREREREKRGSSSEGRVCLLLERERERERCYGLQGNRSGRKELRGVVSFFLPVVVVVVRRRILSREFIKIREERVP